MALSADYYLGRDGMRLRSPPCSIAWEGFEGHTHVMQRCGWEFASYEEPPSHRNPFRDEIRLVFKHRKFGWTGMAVCINARDLMESTQIGNTYGRDNRPVEFQATAMQQRSDQIHLERSRSMAMPHLRRLDMEPCIEMAAHRITMRALDIFRPFEGEEIIVEPETVTELLEKIKKMQAPELAQIRERNRRRERYLEEQPIPEQQEVVSAQIITLRRVA